jgi:hypothetical protein
MRKSETLDEMLDQAYAAVERAKEREEWAHMMAVEAETVRQFLRADGFKSWAETFDALLSRYRALYPTTEAGR